MEQNKEFDMNEELKSYNRKELIEEIARLRFVVLKGNVKAHKKTRKNTLAEVEKVIDEYKNVCLDDNIMKELKQKLEDA